MTSEPKIEHRPAHPYAGVRLQVPIPFGKYLQPAWSKVHKWLAGKGIAHGPAIIRYLTTDMSAKMDLEVGFVMDRVIPGGDGIVTDVLPAGQYATLLYTGPYKGKGIFKANVAIIEWGQKNGIAWKISSREGVEWWGCRVEWYLSDPDAALDPKQYLTELTFMVAEGK